MIIYKFKTFKYNLFSIYVTKLIIKCQTNKKMIHILIRKYYKPYYITIYKIYVYIVPFNF